jgi:beta-lactamase regulating signal transducer with metallopeptidase domain
MNTIISVAAAWSWRSLVLAMAHTLWQSAIIAAILWTVLRILPVRSATARYLAGVIALAATLVAGLVTWSALDHVQQRPAVALIAATEIHSTSGSGSASEQIAPAIPSGFQNIPPASIHWTTVIGWLWLCGAMIMLIRAAAGLVRAQAQIAIGREIAHGPLFGVVADVAKKLHIGRAVAIRVHDDWMIPAVTGLIWPTLLLPASMATGWSMADLHIVIAHELAHVRRFDCLVNFAQQVIEALLFFNPCVWWINRQIRVEREACCDAAAVRLIGSPDAAASLLAKFATRLAAPWQMPPVGLTITGSQPGLLLDRVKRILRPEYRPLIAGPWYLGAGAVALALVALGLLHVSTDAVVEAAEQFLMSQSDVTKIADVQRSLQPPQDVQSAARQVELNGVVHIADGSPVPKGAHVSLQVKSAHTTSGYFASIDQQGRFRIKVEAGELAGAVFDGDGFAPTFAGPFKPGPNGEYPPIELSAERGFDATLKVTDLSGKPVASAAVHSVFVKFFNVGGNTGQTDANGNSVIHHATAAVPAQVDITAPGYEFERVSVPLVDGKTAAIQLTPAKLTTGVVVDAGTGAPIYAATIAVKSLGGDLNRQFWTPDDRLSPAVVLATTDSAGQFKLDVLRSDASYTMWVRAPGHGDANFDAVRAGQTGLVWPLGPMRALRGRITGDLSRLERGKDGPIIRYRLSFHSGLNSTIEGSEQSIPVSVNNGEGSFAVYDLTAANLVFFPPGQFPVEVIEEDLTSTVEIHLDPPATAPIRRQVVFKFDVPAGGALPQGTLRVWQYDLGKRYYPEPKDFPIMHGTVTLDVSAPGRLQYAGGNIAGYFVQDAQNIQITPGAGAFEILVPTVPAGAATGQALEPDGSVCRDFYITAVEVKRSPLLPDNAFFRQNGIQPPSPGPEGRFVVSPLPIGGTYQLVATSKDRVAQGPEFVIDPKAPLTQMTLKFSQGRSIKVKVTDAAGQPRGGVQIALRFTMRKSNSFQGTQHSTERDGTAVWDQINTNADGIYSFVIQPGPDYPGDTVPMKMDANVVNIILKSGLSLHGQVIDDTTARPLKSAEVTATPIYDPANPEMSDRPTTTVRADAQGHFNFSNLGAGKFHLDVRSTAPAGSKIEKLPNGDTITHIPDNWMNTGFTAGQTEDVVLRVIPESR